MAFPFTVDSLLDGTTVYHAGHVLGPQRITVGPTMFNAKSDLYNGGAKGDGVANDAPAIQAALDAAALVGGGIVGIPHGSYLCAAKLRLTSDNVILRGSGWNTVIKAANGLNDDLISTPTTALAVRNYVGVENLAIDGNKANQSAGSALRLYGLRYGFVDRVFIHDAFNQCLMLDSDPGAIGYQNVYSRIVTDVSGGAVYENGHEGCVFRDNVWKWCDGNYMFRCEKGAHKIYANIFGGGGTYTVPALHLRNNLASQVMFNRFDSPRRAGIQIDASNNIVCFNEVQDASASGSALAPAISTGGGVQNCIVVGNRVYAFSTVKYSYAYQENGSNNIVKLNQFDVGVSGRISLPSAVNFVGDNPGYNPLGHAITQPAVPATATPLTNNSGVDAAVFITPGASTCAVSIGGSATGVTLASGGIGQMFRVPAGQTVTLTYTSAPTWQWFGD